MARKTIDDYRDQTYIVYTNLCIEYSPLRHWISPFAGLTENRVSIMTVGGSLVVL